MPRSPSLKIPNRTEPVPLELPSSCRPEIWSPGLVLSSETIVPVAGAYRRVSAQRLLGVAEVSSALSTEAWADAMAAGDGVVVVVALPNSTHAP